MRTVNLRRAQKAQARKLLEGHYGFLALVFVLMTGLNLLMSYILGSLFTGGAGLWNFFLYLASTALMNVFYYLLAAGQTRIYLKLCAGQTPKINDLFFAFSNQPEQLAIYSVIQFILQTAAFNGLLELLERMLRQPSSIFLFLAILLLFGILYIWLQLGLTFVLYLYNDAPWKTMKELLRESWLLIRGSRMKLVILQLSFLGIDLLCLLSFGIGFLFASPYRETSVAVFYRQLKAKNQTSQPE